MLAGDLMKTGNTIKTDRFIRLTYAEYLLDLPILALSEKCPSTELFLVRIQENTNQK